MSPDTLPGIATYQVLIRLRRTTASGPIDGRRLELTIPAPTPCIARGVGAGLATTIVQHLASTGEAWTVDLDRDVTAELAPAEVSPGLVAAEQEMLRADQLARALSAVVNKIGPVALTDDEIDTAVPADMVEAETGTGATWLITPHPDRPAIPRSGLVAASDLGLHRGRKALVPIDPAETNPTGPTRWTWRVIVGSADHPDHGYLVRLRTTAGEQDIPRAGLLSVREPS